MKKILSFFAAMLVAVAANAAVININTETTDALRTALNSAADGDEIVMAAGTYVESNSNYIAFDGKAVTVKAAEGANVIIQPQVPITVSNSGHAIFENVKIDASRLTELADWYEHLLYVTDGTPNGCTFRGCEIYGFNLNKSMFYCNNANKVAMMKFENCYFHDIQKSIIFIENTADKPMVSVKNCTFENIIAPAVESYYAGVIDVRATEATLQVDHCTFYNVIPMNTDYSAVSKITLAKGTVSNCIFMLPTAQDGIRAMRGVTATNCITFNYLKDSGTGIHSSVTQTNCIQQDPKFVNAAEGNFTLGEGSPALTLNDGQPIGDPRWVPAPAPAHTYTVAGSLASVFGETWNPALAANDMVLQNDGTYKWEKTELTLPAGAIEFKVVIDHNWDNGSYPGSNYQLSITEEGIYTITITYEPANDNKVNAVATKTGSAEVDPTAAIKGGWDSWAQEVAFTLAADKKTASGTVNIAAAADYEFKVILNGGDWRSNGYTYHREFTGATGITGNADNMVLTADVAGEYTFTWTFETNALEITFPAVPVVDDWARIVFTAAATADEIAEEAIYTAPGTEFALKLHDAGNKMAIDANDCRFGTAEDYTMYNYRIKSGGASSETKNYFTLNIPKAGTLRLAPRTGSNGATDRALIIAQGETELYNAVVQESQAIEVQEGENTVKVYPYVEVNVAAGEVRVSYTAGMNFYAFAFKAEGGETPTAIESNVVAVKAVKMIENGQLVIIRNGEKFNVQGQVIR